LTLAWFLWILSEATRKQIVECEELAVREQDSQKLDTTSRTCISPPTDVEPVHFVMVAIMSAKQF
jgi:hypothetical protein